MTRRSAGILLHRSGPEVLLGHLGGPLWARRDTWTIPKGEPEPGEDLLDAARREFAEELGVPLPGGAPVPLGEVRQGGGKVVTAWAVSGDLDPVDVVPGTFTLEWPPRSGRLQEFPELDRVAWFAVPDARSRIVGAQAAFLDRLVAALGA